MPPAPATLTTPNSAVHESFVAAAAEFAAEDRDLWGLTWLGLDPAVDHRTDLDRFAMFVAAVCSDADPTVVLNDTRVLQTTLWWTQGAQFHGRLSIRHLLNAHLLEEGGHIGYVVRPTSRRRGHATAMLHAGLKVARGLGISSALVTCDVTNVGSRRVIENNGGVLEDRRGAKLRFWVPTVLP